MTYELIENFILSGKRKDKMVCVHFKNRQAINGIFVFSNDYQEMKRKNFWRIVAESRKDEWLNTKNLSCSRLFSGNEFTKLSDL